MPSLDLILNAVLYGVLVPAVVTALGLLAALRFWRGAAPAAVAAGIGAGLVALAKTNQINWGFLKPERSWEWLPGLALLALLVGLLDQALSLPLVVRWLLRVVVAGLTGWLLVQAEVAIQPREIESTANGWTAAIAVAVLILWGLLDHSARVSPTRLQSALLTLLLFAVGAVMEMSGSSTMAQTGSVVGAAILATCVMPLWRTSSDFVRAPIPAVGVFLPGLLFSIHFNTYASIPSTSYLLLLVSPLPLAALGLSPNRSRTLLLLSATASLLLMSLGVALAARAYTSE
jgi:hypothetical protein